MSTTSATSVVSSIATAIATGGNGGGGNRSTSFIGNTPSTVLFFLALSVGISIAILFVFFTIRYFVRTKYGLYVYPLTPNVLIATTVIPNSFVAASQQEQSIRIRLNDLRTTVQIRYARKRKLTSDEVEYLFPRRTYSDWLNGGQERDEEVRDGKLQEEDDILKHTTAPEGEDPDVLVLSEEQQHELTRTSTLMSVEGLEHEHDQDHDHEPEIAASSSHETPESKKSETEQPEMEEIDLGSKSVQEKEQETTPSVTASPQIAQDLHFTSGMCAICLEPLNDEEDVRGLICGHVFHAECLDPWLTTKRACCPMCKRDYFYKDEHNNSANGGVMDEDEDHRSLNSLLEQFIPTAERATSLLNDPQYSHLELERRAREKQEEMFKFKYRFFWRLMGITRIDIFNWAVVSIYGQARERGEHIRLGGGNNGANTEGEQTQGVSAGTDEQEQGQEHEQLPEEQDSESVESRRDIVQQRV